MTYNGSMITINDISISLISLSIQVTSYVRSLYMIHFSDSSYVYYGNLMTLSNSYTLIT